MQQASSSSSSSEVELRKKVENTQDKEIEEARRSFQSAPERYRKVSSYLDTQLIEQNQSKSGIKEQIESIIEKLGEGEEKKETPVNKRLKFQRRKSSFSSVSSANPDDDVTSIHDQPGICPMSSSKVSCLFTFI